MALSPIRAGYPPNTVTEQPHRARLRLRNLGASARAGLHEVALDGPSGLASHVSLPLRGPAGKDGVSDTDPDQLITGGK